MAKKKKHEEHLNAEAWAIPYGDLITLLLAFFVVMYSMSSVNEGKYRILSDSLVAAFRGAPSSPNPITITKASGQGGGMVGSRPTTLMKLRDPPPSQPGGDAQKKGGFGDEGPPLMRMAAQVREALQGLIDEDLVRVRQTPLQLEVEIKTDILFGSGAASVSPAAEPVIRKLAEILSPFDHEVRVEGHTDDRPIRSAVFPSNWELSSARAANVVHLFTEFGIAPRRMEVLGYGEQRPVADNATLEGRNANRRVVVVVSDPRAGAPTGLAMIEAPAPDARLVVPGAPTPAAAVPPPPQPAPPSPTVPATVLQRPNSAATPP
jgi:chemotaxis protein MotB